MNEMVCPGFNAIGSIAGLKKGGLKDLGIIFSERPAAAAGVFTRNKVKAACVQLNQTRLQAGGRCQAVIVNSGNANCCTGRQGMEDAKETARLAAAALGIEEDLVLVASTGVIGKPLPMENIRDAVPRAAKELTPHGIVEFAEAIMTTDTMPKILTRTGEIGGKTFTVMGVAKGAGMIRPDMATMLCFVCTDVEARPEVLQPALSVAVDRSFNRITIDGDTSTNDMVLLLANGVSGIRIEGTDETSVFQEVLDDVLLGLAKRVVKDGEGATKLVEIKVTGALTNEDARKLADTVAHSNLVKTALFGEDANWGRIIAAAGRSGASVDPDRIDIFFDHVQMVKDGLGCGWSAEDDAGQILRQNEYEILIDLNLGAGQASMFTCDFSMDYVKINADYRS